MEFHESLEAIYFIWRVIPAWDYSIESTLCPEFAVENIGQRYLVFKYNDNETVVRVGGRIKWPGNVYVDNENTFKLTFEKKKAQNWTKPLVVGEPKVVGEYQWKDRLQAKIKDKVFFNNGLCLISMQFVNKVFNYIGPGRFVYIIPTIKEIRKRHPFYPFPSLPLEVVNNKTVFKLEENGEHELETMLYVLTDVKKPGTVADRLCLVAKGDLVTITMPTGKFCLAALETITSVFVLAYEFGIVPAMSIIVEVLRKTKGKTIKLLHINNSDLGVIMAKEVHAIADSDKRFSYEYLISKPSLGFKDYIGNFSENTLERFIDTSSRMSTNFFVISGKNTFVFETGQIIKSFGYKGRQITRLLC